MSVALSVIALEYVMHARLINMLTCDWEEIKIRFNYRDFACFCRLIFT